MTNSRISMSPEELVKRIRELDESTQAAIAALIIGMTLSLNETESNNPE